MIETIEEYTRQAVHQVSEKMLGLNLKDDSTTALIPNCEEQIASSVGFTGQVTGVIYLSAGMGFAKTVTSRMLGMEEAELEGDMINDAFGELSNMVVGSVKSRLCDKGMLCTLSIPSIVRGKLLSVEGVEGVTRKAIGFTQGTRQVIAEILVKEPQI